MEIISREKAVALLKKFNSDAFHLRHALTVEAVMRVLARKFGEDEDFWGIAGLLHDVDFEMFPEMHCRKSDEILREAGVCEEIVRAVASHGWGICSDIEPKSMAEKWLFACDELSGLIWSASLVRPSKSVQDMELSSLKKKFKDKTFAQGCSRDAIRKGAEILALPLDEVFQVVLDAMKEVEPKIDSALTQL